MTAMGWHGFALRFPPLRSSVLLTLEIVAARERFQEAAAIFGSRSCSSVEKEADPDPDRETDSETETEFETESAAETEADRGHR